MQTPAENPTARDLANELYAWAWALEAENAKAMAFGRHTTQDYGKRAAQVREWANALWEDGADALKRRQEPAAVPRA